MASEVHHIDLHAPIVPGKSAGGFEVGTNLRDLSMASLAPFVPEKINHANIADVSYVLYHSESLILYERNSILDQIAVRESYQGKLPSGLGVNDLVKDFEKEYGPIEEGEEDELIFPRLHGVCIEPTYPVDFDYLNWQRSISSLRVSLIYIYDPSRQTP